MCCGFSTDNWLAGGVVGFDHCTDTERDKDDCGESRYPIPVDSRHCDCRVGRSRKYQGDGQYEQWRNVGSIGSVACIGVM